MKLFTYSYSAIGTLKQRLGEKDVVGIGAILNHAPNINSIASLYDNLTDVIIDVTSLSYNFGDTPLFMERFLYALIDCYDDIIFAVLASQATALTSKFPYIFTDIECDNPDATTDDAAVVPHEAKKELVTRVPLYLYGKAVIDTIQDELNIISLGTLFEGTDNLIYNFNKSYVVKMLESTEVEYIDISSMIEMFRLRKDQILTFDILLKQLFQEQPQIKFLICDDSLDELKDYLPFSFEITTLDNEKKIPIEIPPSATLDLQNITDSIYENLKGHDAFKEEFSFQLKKYIFLNNLNERKIFSIFLSGESGIGKTEFAKMLSTLMYPNERLIKINFGNYSNEGVLNSLIGSPLGYVGSEEGGELLNKIKSSKSKIILIDEFEKATPAVFHFFYELLEDGRFTDRHGIECNLNGYIIVFTSNMTRKQYSEKVPDPLKSRFDLVYYFVGLPPAEKEKFARLAAEELIRKIYGDIETAEKMQCVEKQMDSIIKSDNLRDIKRKIEDIVIDEHFQTIVPVPNLMI